MRKKYLLFNLNFFPTFKRYKRTGNVKKFIKVKLFGEKLKEVKKPKIKGIKKKNIIFIFKCLTQGCFIKVFLKCYLPFFSLFCNL